MTPIAFYGRVGDDSMYLPWALANGPALQQGGYTRLMFHNPGGAHSLPERGDDRIMWPDQWALAEQKGKPFASRDQLAACHTILRDLYGIQEINYYIGSPMLLPDPYFDGLDCCEPFMLLGASFGFDHSARPYEFPRWKFDRLQLLISDLRGQGHKVYVEARCDVENPELAGQVDGTTALVRYDAKHNTVPAEHLQFGEVLLLSDGAKVEDEQLANLPPEVTPLLRNWGRVRL